MSSSRSPPVLISPSSSSTVSSSSSSSLSSIPFTRLPSLPHSSLDAISQPSLFDFPWIFSSPPIGIFTNSQTHFDSRNDMENFLGGSALVEISLWFDPWLCGLQAIFLVAGQRIHGPRYGRNQNSPQIFLIDGQSGEFISSISGVRNSDYLLKFSIETNRGKKKSFGVWNQPKPGTIQSTAEISSSVVDASSVAEFNFDLPAGSRLVGFFGDFDSTRVTNIGILHQTEKAIKMIGLGDENSNKIEQSTE